MGRFRVSFLIAVSVGFYAGCGDKITGEGHPSPVLSIPSMPTPINDADFARCHRPFSEAVSEQSPGNQQLPPNATIAGISTTKVRQEVERLWDTIRFVTPSGKTVVYLAVVNTDFGCFRMQLLPEIAPNHVRNFVALAKAGYYDGLTFEHLIHQQGDEGTDSKLELVEGGCPLGTGEPGIGHLGYWLRPEISDVEKHEPGSVGAFHDDDPDSAACRFYVTLTKAPAMDGNFTVFGRVVEGLDVVRTISRQPRLAGSFVPEKSTKIRSVTIETQEVR